MINIIWNRRKVLILRGMEGRSSFGAFSEAPGSFLGRPVAFSGLSKRCVVARECRNGTTESDVGGDARLKIQTIISSRISSQATLSVFVIPYGRGGAMTQQPAIWIGTIEIRLSDEVKPHAFRSAFTVVTTWAVSPAEFRERCIGCRGTTDGSCSALNELTPCRKFSEEVEDMLERTRTNPSGITYGTF